MHVKPPLGHVYTKNIQKITHGKCVTVIYSFCGTNNRLGERDFSYKRTVVACMVDHTRLSSGIGQLTPIIASRLANNTPSNNIYFNVVEKQQRGCFFFF